MSVNLYWTLEKRKDFKATAKSSIKEALERAGFNLPYRFNAGSLDRLYGMQAAAPGEEINFYAELIDLIEKHEEVMVGAAY